VGALRPIAWDVQGAAGTGPHSCALAPTLVHWPPLLCNGPPLFCLLQLAACTGPASPCATSRRQTGACRSAWPLHPPATQPGHQQGAIKARGLASGPGGRRRGAGAGGGVEGGRRAFPWGPEGKRVGAGGRRTGVCQEGARMSTMPDMRWSRSTLRLRVLRAKKGRGRRRKRTCGE